LELTGGGGQYLKIEDGISPERRPKWSDLVNGSEAEMVANQAILEMIATAVTQNNPGQRAAEVLKMVHTAVHTIYNGKKHGVIGRHKLMG
jgi:hypothetical protein